MEMVRSVYSNTMVAGLNIIPHCSNSGDCRCVHTRPELLQATPAAMLTAVNIPGVEPVRTSGTPPIPAQRCAIMGQPVGAG